MRLVFALLTLLFLALPQVAGAGAKPGIIVTPSIIHLDLSLDPPETEIYYKNTTNTEIELAFLAQDFSELEEGGKVNFLEKEDAQNYQYSLSSWLTFEKQSITLGPGQEQKIKVFVNQDKLTPGGHYASVQAQLVQAAEIGKVPVKVLLSTLIFVRTQGGNVREELSFQSISPMRTLLGFPETFLIRLQNKGNVEVVPHGLVEIKGPFGKTAAKGIINEGSLITLPESIRRFDVPLVKTEAFIPPGVYTAQVNVHFGNEDKNITSQTTFVSQGSINFLLVGLITLAVMIALFARKSFQARRHQRP